MQPTSNQDYKQLLSEVIKKQIVILGPDITLSKARNVKGLTVADDGTVTDVEGQPQEVTQALIDQFVQLSGLIVKKTMEPLLSMSQGMSTATPTPAAAPTPVATTPAPQSATQPQPVMPTVSTNQIDPAAQAIIDQALAQQPAGANPAPTTAPTAQPTTQPTATGSQEQVQPAKNPLAA